MKAKDFFKSTSFRCIATLLAIVLVCGIFLTFCNALFKVTDQERFDRAISKIYGKSVETESFEISDEYAAMGEADILEAYKVLTDGNYLVKSKGKGGYDSGTVTCWVVVKISGSAVTGVEKVVIESNEKQSYIDRVTDKALNEFSEKYQDGKEFSQDMITGATVIGTKTAICNAVNGAIAFVKAAALGVSVSTPTPYDDFAYTAYIDKKQTTHSFADGVVTYQIVTVQNGLVPNPYDITVAVNADGTIAQFTITKFGSFAYGDNDFPALEYGNRFSTYLVGKTAEDIIAILGTDKEDMKVTDTALKTYEEDGKTIFTGATQSNFACLYAALFAASNVDKAISSAFSYTAYIDEENTAYSYDGESGVVTYQIVTVQNGLVPNPYNITVAVNADGTIAQFTITKFGSFAYGDNDFPTLEYGNRFSTYLVGKTAEDIIAILGTDKEDMKVTDTALKTYEEDGKTIFTGATQSNFACLYAALYATANYSLIPYIAGGAN